MKNLEVAVKWLIGENAYGSHFFTDGRVIYSYGLHFPLAYRFDDRVILLNEEKYSVTTSKHTTLVKQAIRNHTHNYDIIYVHTEDLKEMIKKGISLFSQLRKK
jgi:hypothetical protein